MLKYMIFLLECSRYYALPMTFFSWLIIFTYSLKYGGKPMFGIMALIGIMSAHLAANLFDDLCDYKILTKIYDKKIVLPNTQRGKCKYLTNGSLSERKALLLFLFYCLIAFLIGVFFIFKYGLTVLLLMTVGGLIVLFYSFLSYHLMSELAVGIAFGPLLFFGTYYVMTGKISSLPLLLSLPSMLFTVNLLYTDTFMDKNIDKNEGKYTLVNFLGGGEKALYFQVLILLAGYLSTILLYKYNLSNYKIFFIILTIPLAIDLIKSVSLYITSPADLPPKRWYHFPFEYWRDIQENRSVNFMFRMYQARNLMIYNSLFIFLSVL